MSLAKFSTRELRARPMRAILTLASITIGVAAVVSVMLVTSTVRLAQKEMASAIAGEASLEVVSDGSQGFSYEIVKELNEVPGVEVAVPTLKRFASVFVGESKARTQVLGIDPRVDQQVRGYEISEGRQPQNLAEIMLDESFAFSIGAAIDDQVKILGRGGLNDYTLVGLVRPTGADGLTLGSAAYMVLPAAQRAFRLKNVVDQVLVKSTAEANSDAATMELQQRIAAILPEGVDVRPPRVGGMDTSKETTFATENGLMMSIAFALLISLFIIYNTFQMAVGERRKQLGVLRAIGATPRQVGRLILGEALLLSVAGTLIGAVLGVVGANYGITASSTLLQVELPRVAITPLPFIVAAVFGSGVSLLGAYLPARRASSVSPLEAMRAIELEANNAVIKAATPLGFVFVPAGALLLYLTTLQILPIGADVVAIVMMLLGCVLLIPLLLQPVSSWVGGWLERFVGVEARLAQRQLTRHIGRSTLTVGVLFIALGTTTGMAGNILDNVRNVRLWYQRTFAGDFFVRASMPDLATGTSADIPDGVGDQLRQLPGIKSIDTVRFVQSKSGDSDVLLVAGSYGGEDSDQVAMDLVQGDFTTVSDALRRGEVIVGSVLAQRREYTVGDTVPFQTESGTEERAIAAIANDYVGGGLTIHMDASVAQRDFGITGVDAYVIRAEKGQLRDLQTSLQVFCREQGLIFQSYADMVAFVDSMINGVVAILWVLLGLGFVIAAMGLVNTLTMNILEQTREIGMLRVVAMTQSQVRRMVFSQAVLLGIIGLLPGAVAGVFVSWAIGLSSQAVLGHDVEYLGRPGLTFGCLAVGFAVVLASSMLPARRAARLNLAEALQHE